MKLMDALNRIERAGQENSRTTRKLIEAATVVVSDIADKAKIIDPPIEVLGGQFNDDDDGVVYTRVYTIHQGNVRLGGSNGDREWRGECLNKVISRAYALDLAMDITDGLLDKIAEAIEARAKKEKEAITVLEESK